MKLFHRLKTLSAVAVITAAGHFCRAQDALPADITPGSPLADVVKMVQSGVAPDTIQSYVANSAGAFNLDADKILFLKDEGVSSALVNAMLERDKVLYAGSLAPPPVPAPANNVASAPATAPPPAEVTVNYFNNTLTPYGSWVEVEGYGRCWRPTAVIYDAGWRPYCDRGHWVYTDYGWYWDSDYSWGVTFHYGRWFRDARFGWCWYPDTVWAPSWVTWRSGGDYFGWAPLPPLTVYRPGFGFFYRGGRVAADFDFGLNAGSFIFISPEHFSDRHPRSFRVPPERVTQIFRQTKVINDYNVNNRTIINHGIPVERISGATHRAIEPVRIGSLPNAGRQGWHGPVEKAPARNPFNENTQRPGAVQKNIPSRNEPVNVREHSIQPDPAHEPGNLPNHSQSGVNNHVQPPNVSPTVRSTPTAAPKEWQPNHNEENSTGAALPQHGANQLKPNYNSRPKSNSSPNPTAQPQQSYNTGNEPNSGRDKQNH